MKRKGLSLVKLNVDELISRLNSALADEWLAYYQYWVGSKVVSGVTREAAVAELVQHAADELRHAEMLATRIIQLGGTPLLNPKDWMEKSGCGYAAPTDPAVLKVLEQNVKGEQCAIETYSALADFTREGDPVTYLIVLEILKDEIEHEDDLMTLMEDMD
jgi:bacterioferritin